MSLYSTSSAYAKDFWLPVLNNQFLNDEGSLLNKIGINWDAPVKLEGRRWYMKLGVGDDLGFGVITSPGGDFAAPGDTAYDEATLSLMRFNDVIQLDGHEAGLLDSLDAAAAPDIMARKMGAAQRRVMRELERMAIMDGTGVLATVSSVSGTTFNFTSSGSTYPIRNRYTWIDDPNRSYYRIVDNTTGADALSTPAKFTFSSVNESGNSAVASATLTGATSGQYLVTDYGQTAWNVGGAFTSPEFPGLLAAIDTSGTYLGINRATASKAYWKATVLSNSGTLRTFTETLAMQLLSQMARRSDDGGTIDGTNYFGLASFGVWNSYQTLMTPGIRYGISDVPDIGWGGREYLPMHGVPLYKHIKAPRNQVLVVHRPSMHFVTAKHASGGLFDFQQNPSGGIWFQTPASGTTQGYADSRQAVITGWLGMYTDKPRNHGRLDDLTETAGSY